MASLADENRLSFLWERHLAAMISWLEATATEATLHFRFKSAQRISLPLFYKKHATRLFAATSSTHARKPPCGRTFDGKPPIAVRV
jgi:hypothetical protein